MKVKPSFIVRAPDRAGRRACSRRKPVVVAAPTYPAGFFLQLVLQHDWPPRFVSRWAAQRSYAPQAESSRAMREAGVGHAGKELGLRGAVEYIKRWKADALKRGAS